MTQTPTDKIYQIVEQAMCIGCGICQSIAGSDAITLKKSVSGYQHPLIKSELSVEIADEISNLQEMLFILHTLSLLNTVLKSNM